MSALPSPWPKSPSRHRLRVGECLVDIPLREITRPDGVKTRVTLKSVAVLLVLAEQAGRVVSREALLDAVWAGTLPTIDVVTQAIAALRKAFDDNSEAPTYVETIPKGGYRLLATIQWLDEPQAATVTGDPQVASSGIAPTRAAPGRRGGAVIATGAALLAALSWSMAGWQNAPESARKAGMAGPPATGEMSYTLLTSRPGKEIDPSLSPDGASVAYAMSPDSPGRPTAIFVQSSQPTPARQLTAPPPGFADRMPRWSPDGRQVMFVRQDRQQGCELRLLPATGGMERVVGRCDRFNGGRYDWLPDGSGIVAGLSAESDGKPAPLSILRLDSGQWEAMHYPIAPGNVDFDPRFSPDGSRLGFRRNLVRSEVWAMPAQGGPPAQLTRLRAQIHGWDWAADGRSLLLGLGNGVPKLVRHDLETGRTAILGHFPASSLDAASRGGNLVFALATSSTAMFRYPLPLREAAEPQPLFASTGTDELPSPSPDGRTIAFYSTRSHEARVWIGEPDHPDRLRMIDGIVPTRMHPPIWSPDGSRILVVGDPVGDGGPQGPRLFEIEVASGRSSQVALEGAPYFAQYLPGQRMLALTDLGSGKSSLLVIDRASPGRVLARLDEVGEARFDPGSGQVYFVRFGTPGLWRAGLDLAAPVLLDERWPIVFWHMWALLDGKVLALRSVPGCPAEWYWIGPAPDARTGCLDRARGSDPAMETMASQDGRWLYASMSTAPASTDIGLLELRRLR